MNSFYLSRGVRYTTRWRMLEDDTLTLISFDRPSSHYIFLFGSWLSTFRHYAFAASRRQPACAPRRRPRRRRQVLDLLRRPHRVASRHTPRAAVIAGVF